MLLKCYGETSCFTYKKKSWERQKGTDMMLKEEADYLVSFQTGMGPIRCWGAPSVMWISWQEKTSTGSFDRFILIGQAYLPISTSGVNCEKGFGLSADKQASQDGQQEASCHLSSLNLHGLCRSAFPSRQRKQALGAFPSITEICIGKFSVCHHGITH